MIIKQEISLENFEAWSGAVDTLDTIIRKNKCEQLEAILEDLYPNGMTDTELNDMLWFQEEEIYEWLGIRSYEVIKEELEEAKDELEELMENYAEACEELEEEASEEEWRNGKLEQEKEDLWADTYESDVEELREKIAELEEELEDY